MNSFEVPPNSSAGTSSVPEASGGSAAISPQEIREELDRIIRSAAFQSSKRRQDILSYLVNRAVAGAAQVKEYELGVDVFSKPPDYDPRIDPGVRVEAGRLRAKLEEYYAADGSHNPIRILLPKGSYLIRFEHQPSSLSNAAAEFAEPNEASSSDVELAERAASSKRSYAIFLSAAAISLFAAGILFWRSHVESAAGRPIGTLAVLPFQNISGAPQDAYFSDGVAGEISTALAETGHVRVLARTSAMQFKDKPQDVRSIGKALNVDAVMEGAVRHDADHYHVSVQLSRTSDGYQVWAASYDVSDHDPYSIETKITTGAMKALSASPPPTSASSAASLTPEQHRLQLEARYLLNSRTPEGIGKSVDLFNQIIAQKPDYAPAYAELAKAYAVGWGNEVLGFDRADQKAEDSARRALQLDPRNADAYEALGQTASIRLDFETAERDLNTASSLTPDDVTAKQWLGVALMDEGRFAEANAQFQSALDIDPLALGVRVDMGVADLYARDFTGALAEAHKALDLNPDFRLAHLLAGMAYECEGNYAAAQTEYTKVNTQSTGDADARWRLVHLDAKMGKRAEAGTFLRKQIHTADPNDSDAYEIARVYAALGQPQQALVWLQKAVNQHRATIMKVDPFLDPIRSFPEYAALVKRIGA